MFSRTMGSTLAVGAMGALLSNVVRREAHVPPEVMQAVLVRRDGFAAHSLALGEGARLTDALSHGLALVFWSNAALAIAGVVLGLFFPPIRALVQKDRTPLNEVR